MTEETVEAKLARMEERLANHIVDEEKLLAALQESVDGMKSDLTRYKGFIGGVTFIISALFTVLTLVKERILG